MTETCCSRGSTTRATPTPPAHLSYVGERACARATAWQRDDVHDAMRWLGGITLFEITTGGPRS